MPGFRDSSLEVESRESNMTKAYLLSSAYIIYPAIQIEIPQLIGIQNFADFHKSFLPHFSIFPGIFRFFNLCKIVISHNRNNHYNFRKPRKPYTLRVKQFSLCRTKREFLSFVGAVSLKLKTFAQCWMEIYSTQQTMLIKWFYFNGKLNWIDYGQNSIAIITDIE